MLGKPKLTEAQRDPLFRLVEFQRDLGRAIVYGQRGGDSVDIRSVGYVEEHGLWGPSIVSVPCEYIRCWQERGFVTLGERSVGGAGPSEPFASLILNSDAIEYEERMSKAWLVRIVLDWLDDWGKDLRTGVVAFVVALLTALALNWCGVT